MKKIELLKKGVSLIVGIGTAKIVHDFIERNVDTSTPLNKVTVGAASAAIGGAVAELTQQYTNRQIDEMAELFQKIVNRKTESDSIEE